MNRTSKTNETHRLLISVAMATLCLAGAGGGSAADAPAAGKAVGQAGRVQTEPGLQYVLSNTRHNFSPEVPEPAAVPDIGTMDTGKKEWAVKFIGLLTPPAKGEYAFRAEADSGVRLNISGMKVFDGWSQDSSPSNRTGKIQLAKGTTVDFQLEYWYARTNTPPTLRLFWTPPGGQEAPVPPTAYSHPAPFIIVQGDERNRANTKLPDGGLKPVVGAQSIQVFRACRPRPELADGQGWTYHHHHDLAVWKGRFYAVWGTSPIHEDVGPYRVVYATSTDGFHWSAPVDYFPPEVALFSRFYFYRAAKGRMLAVCDAKLAGRSGQFDDHHHGTLLVREITADHRLGDVFTLNNLKKLGGLPPPFETATDAGFKDACAEAVGNNALLEQADYGLALGDRKMSGHGQAPSPGLKAFCFYHRKDGCFVGVCKTANTTLSEDEGKTWFRPMRPPTLPGGTGKVWGQRTGDGRYAIVTHAKGEPRYPLVIVHGDDGREFRDMRVVNGEVPRHRYEGGSKDPGLQYMRGLAEWADDGSIPDTKQAMWIVYSMNKEDLWVSRIPLPVKPDETEFPTDDFAKATPGGVVPGWNLYSPKWAPATVVEKDGKRSLELRDADPYDYARAIRVFPETGKVRVELDLTPAQTDGRIEISLCAAGGREPVRVMLTETGLVQALDGKAVAELGKYEAGKPLSLVIAADAAAGRYSVQMNGVAARDLALAAAAADVKALQRLSLRTGVWRGVLGVDEAGNKGPGHAGKVHPQWVVDDGTDVPLPTPAVFQVQRVKLAAQ